MFMSNEYIVTFNEINEIIVKKKNLPNPVRTYPALPNFRCKICQSPYVSTEKCRNHEGLKTDSKCYPHRVFTIGYYEYDYTSKMAGNQLTKDIFFARSSLDSGMIKIFGKIIYEIIKIHNLSPSHLSFIPSREESNILTLSLVEIVSKALNLEFIDSSQFIEIDYKEPIRDESKFDIRSKNIKNTFLIKNDEREVFGIEKLLLIDDIMHFGLTLNHFCQIFLKKSDVNEIEAIVLARSIPYRFNKRKLFL